MAGPSSPGPPDLVRGRLSPACERRGVGTEQVTECDMQVTRGGLARAMQKTRSLTGQRAQEGCAGADARGLGRSR